MGPLKTLLGRSSYVLNGRLHRVMIGRADQSGFGHPVGGAAMGDEEHLGIYIDFWDDAVGAFEPAKVLRQLRRAFPTAEVDPTDHQRARLMRELDAWSRSVADPEQRETMVRQSWGLYQTNGPTYRFAVPFPSGHRVGGGARRLSVFFRLPPGLPPDCRGQILAFLRSLRMGEPKPRNEREPVQPEAEADYTVE
jgi:hypothetical protein